MWVPIQANTNIFNIFYVLYMQYANNKTFEKK